MTACISATRPLVGERRLDACPAPCIHFLRPKRRWSCISQVVLIKYPARASTSANWPCRRSPPGQVALPSWACRSATVDPLPQGLRVEVKPEDGTKNVEYDEENKVVRIPLSALDAEGQRRSKLVMFTCNRCGGRTARLVNPVAWEKGVVFGQCSKCDVWHVLSAKNKNIFEEVRYKEDPEYRDILPPAEATDMNGKEDGPAAKL